MTRDQQLQKLKARRRELRDRRRNAVHLGMARYVAGFEAQVENRIGGRKLWMPFVAHPEGRGFGGRPRRMWVAGWNAAVAVELMMRGRVADSGSASESFEAQVESTSNLMQAGVS